MEELDSRDERGTGPERGNVLIQRGGEESKGKVEI